MDIYYSFRDMRIPEKVGLHRRSKLGMKCYVENVYKRMGEAANGITYRLGNVERIKFLWHTIMRKEDQSRKEGLHEDKDYKSPLIRIMLINYSMILS